MKHSGPSAKVKSTQGWLIGTKINRPSMRHKWARTGQEHHPQKACRSWPFCMRLSRARWIHLKREKCSWSGLWLCIGLPLLKTPEAQNSTPPFVSLARHMVCMEWAKAHFLHSRKCHEASEDHCLAYCRIIGEPWLAHKHILFTHGLGSKLSWRSYVLILSNKASWESRTAKV